MKRIFCGLTLCLAFAAGQARAEGVLLTGNQAYAVAQQLYADTTVGQPTAKAVSYLTQKLGYQLVGRFAHLVPNSDIKLYEEFYSVGVYTTVEHIELQWNASVAGNGYRLTGVTFSAPDASVPDNMATYNQESDKDRATFQASRIAGFRADAVLGAALKIYEAAYSGLKAPRIDVYAQTSKSGADWLSYSSTYLDVAPNLELLIFAGAPEIHSDTKAMIDNVYRLSVGTQAAAFMGTTQTPY